LGGKRIPLLAGFKLTHLCNLHCIHCPFWENYDGTMLTFEQVKDVLRKLHRLGVRILILEGGEPFLWREGNCGLREVIEEAKKLFYSVGVTTNGTFPLTINPHTIWVSIDGMKETNDRIRGETFDIIMNNIQQSSHPNILANITINRLNFREIPDLIRFLNGKVKGITIQFHYPYEKNDSLYLSFAERRAVLDHLIELKKQGFPISDSFACLKALKENSWKCEDWMLANAEPDGKINLGCYVKNRGEINCSLCGFAAHTEISFAYHFMLNPILVGMRVFRYGCSSLS
jgi:MoaA/NifB/PqqE/SkfB family radical SAM enzyme